MEIVNNKAIVITTRRPNLVTECIHKSEIVETNGDLHKVAVRWGLEEAQALSKLGIKNVPSPIQRDYKWPGLYKPMDHQKETSNFLLYYINSEFEILIKEQIWERMNSDFTNYQAIRSRIQKEKPFAFFGNKKTKNKNHQNISKI